MGAVRVHRLADRHFVEVAAEAVAQEGRELERLRVSLRRAAQNQEAHQRRSECLADHRGSIWGKPEWAA